MGEKGMKAVLSAYAPVVVFGSVMTVGGMIILNQRIQDGPLQSYTAFITFLSRWLVDLFGFDIVQQGRVLGSPDGSFAMRVDNECNGLWAHLILLASILAYPASWAQRAAGLVLGQAALFLINIFRIASLFAIGVYLPSLFRAAHVYVWQFLIIGFAFVALFVWVEKGVRPSTEHNA